MFICVCVYLYEFVCFYVCVDTTHSFKLCLSVLQMFIVIWSRVL